jgi:uncharacterized protein YndB with AHSA1/START domain
MMTLPCQVDRSVVIRATPEVVFRFFTDTSHWARWWGAGSTIDPRPGGKVAIRYPEGTEASGEVLEIAPPERIVFTYGYNAGAPIPPGGSRITIRVEPTAEGARVRLTHDVADPAVRDDHVQGWRYHLSVFSALVSDEVNAGAAGRVDAWFEAWSAADPAVREARLAQAAARGVRFQDRFSNITGVDELMPHLAAAQRFMPGITMTRVGEVRHCQGTALADWVATVNDGEERARGTNVFVFDGTGKIESVTGLWSRHPGGSA